MKALLITSLAFTAVASADYKPVPLAQGASAPDFSLVNVDDKTMTLADIKGEKATAIIFTTNHCPDAIAAVGRTKALVEKFKPQGVGFVAINSNSPEGLHLAELAFTTGDDSFEAMKPFAKDNELNHPYLYDGDTQEVAKAYGAISTPHIFIFDSDLKLKYNGRIDDGSPQHWPRRKERSARCPHLHRGRRGAQGHQDPPHRLHHEVEGESGQSGRDR